jgi:hypothetical protein
MPRNQLQRPSLARLDSHRHIARSTSQVQIPQQDLRPQQPTTTSRRSSIRHHALLRPRSHLDLLAKHLRHHPSA